MNWIKANKFLTGFFAVMLVGIGVLGYFLITASGAYDTADDNYTSKATELHRLRTLPLYPNAGNLKALEAQKTEAAGMVAAFQVELAKKQFTADEMTPQAFQDKLKKSVTDILAAAAAANVEFPKDKFYLGFDPYETRPPEKEAVGPLNKQLKSIEWVMQKLIEAKITKLTSLKRIPLPEEKSLASSNNRRQSRDNREERREKELVSMYPFDIEFTAKQKSIAQVLDVVVGSSAPQFFIPRVVRLYNQKSKGPERAPAGAANGLAGTPGAPAAPAAPAGAAPAQPTVPLGYIVGDELIEANLRLEIVEFAAPGEDVAPKAKASK